jgi:alkylation response protein AidB-like acyl-CoA dehydrogenase
MSSVSSLRRCIALATAFARVRHVGGEKGTLLIANESHTGALVRCEIVHRALLQFVFTLIGLLGKVEAEGESNVGEEEKDRLRLLTPVAKAFSADLATNEMPHCLEALGGQGYMVENEIGRLISDTNVERIWEGYVPLSLAGRIH